jgi:exopolysaccharide biosynthesis operon protein EpsL
MAPSQSGFWPPANGIFGKRLLVAALAATFSPASFALWGDRLELFVDEAYTYDSNVFRLSKNVDPVTVTGSDRKSDTWWTTTLGFNLDVPVSLQRFQLNYAWTDSRYQHFDTLSHRGHTARADWLWAVRRELTGDVGYAEQENLASFANIQGTTPDIVKTRQTWLNGAWLVTPSWRAHTALTAGDARHGDPARRINDLEAASAEVGLSYVTASENRVGVAARYEEGRSPHSVVLQGVDFDNAYKQASIGAQTRWVITGHSRLDGRVDYTKRDYEQFQNRNYSGPTARVTYTWTPTGKTTIATTLYRDVAPLEDIQSRFVLTTGVNIRPQWDVTSKVSVRGNVEYVKWDYRGDQTLGANFEHRVRAVGAGVVYKPTRNILVQGTYQHEDRTSTIPTGDYKVDYFIVEGRLGF